MFGVGTQEALIVGLVALLIFGADGLADAARACGAALGRARMWLDESREELASADYPDEWFDDPGGTENTPLDEHLGG